MAGSCDEKVNEGLLSIRDYYASIYGHFYNFVTIEKNPSS